MSAITTTTTHLLVHVAEPPPSIDTLLLLLILLRIRRSWNTEVHILNTDKRQCSVGVTCIYMAWAWEKPSACIVNRITSNKVDLIKVQNSFFERRKSLSKSKGGSVSYLWKYITLSMVCSVLLPSATVSSISIPLSFLALIKSLKAPQPDMVWQKAPLKVYRTHLSVWIGTFGTVFKQDHNYMQYVMPRQLISAM